MADVALNPYLNFNGEAKEAMEFYHSIFGGKLDIQTFGEAGLPNVAEDEKSLIIHAKLETEGVIIMASDGGRDHPVSFGSNVHLSLQGDDEKTLTEWFNMLSEGGKITMPLAKQFWGDIFGMLTDKYGVGWMINIAAKKST